MTVLAIILLVVFGFLLIMLEFFVVPGITIAGIGGILLMAGGVYLAYDVFGAPTGHYYLGAVLLISIILVSFAFRSDTWKRMMLKSEIKGKINTHKDEDFKAGDTGITISRLAPMGTVEVNNLTIEGQSDGPFLDQGIEIEVIKVQRNKLIVKPKI
ncbi:MAG: NfeD family protein [Bacteroidota bacterium]|nr:NfeD family protein [Bacteroidota bacterium]